MFEQDNYTENQPQAAQDSMNTADTEKNTATEQNGAAEQYSENGQKDTGGMEQGTSNINAGSSGNNNANMDGNGWTGWRNPYQQSGPTYYNGGGQGQWSQSRQQDQAQGQWSQNQNGYGQYQSYQNNYQYGSGDYGRNQNSDYGRMGSGKQERQSSRKERKQRSSTGSVWKKALALVLSGICFGVFAGVSFLAVSSLGGDKQPASGQPVIQEQAEVSQPAAEADVKPEIKTTMSNGTVTAVVTDVTEVVERTMPSIVAITNQTITSVADFWGQTYEREESSAGSGIIIGQNDTELLIVTNNHVIDGSDKLSVKFIDDEVVEALTKGTSPSMDLAVVAVKLDDIKNSTREQISVAAMGDSDALKVGEPVIAIGNALGYGQSVTTGVVSALNRAMEIEQYDSGSTLIQTDAAINPGNSGGALLDINGNVIGINSSKIGGSTIEGMGYAIPISAAQPIIEDLMNRETRERVEAEDRGYLGISCINVNASMSQAYGMPEGILIAQVYPGSGADKAGLVKGDVIVGFGGDKVISQDALVGALEYYAVGDTVKITVMRGNITDGYEEMTVDVTLTSQEVMNVED